MPRYVVGQSHFSGNRVTLTTLGEAGVDIFTLKTIAGHSSITITQRYVHTQRESIRRAFEKVGDSPQARKAEKKAKLRKVVNG